MVTSGNTPFVFGIYPGGEAGVKARIQDDFELMDQLIQTLQGSPERPFRVRGYLVYTDESTFPSDQDQLIATAGLPSWYPASGQLIDLVLAFQSDSGDVYGFTEFVRQVVRLAGTRLDTLQITEEPNALNNVGYVDGDYPRVREALVRGMLAAKAESTRLGLEQLKIGFNVVPAFGDDFFEGIYQIGGDAWVQTVDYVGLDCFPGVWVMPEAEPHELGAGAVSLLEWLRNDRMPIAGLSARVPIILAENGWPTTPGRSLERQPEIIEGIVRAVHSARERLNVEGHTLFSLRDADSTNPIEFANFGVLFDDYSPKPAFDVYRRLVAELSVAPVSLTR